MKNHWLDRARQRLQADSTQEGGLPLERLKALGMINDRGEVTGHLRRWDAFLAITEVKRNRGAPEIDVFRCLKPVFGMPGSATIDVSRDSMVSYLREGKKIVTARRDDRLDMWMEGDVIQLSSSGFVRSNGADDSQDNVGNLPEFQQTASRL